MTSQTVHYLGNLRQQIDRYYRPEELRLLCLDLGVDYDQIPGDTKLLKVNTLVWQYGRSNRLAELLISLRNQNPDISWPDDPKFEQRNGHRTNGASRAPRSILQNYLEELKKRLLDLNLQDSRPGSDARISASAMTLDTLHRLDGKRKRELVQFLWESGLIARREPIINMQGADFCRVDLSWINLSKANLSQVNLTGADLGLADLHDSDLSGTNLRGAILRSNLAGADLVGADLRESDLSDAKVVGAKLTGANLGIVRLNRADLSCANLVGADLHFSNLQGTNLTDALLQWANLRMSNMREANLFRADLSGSDLTGAEVSIEQIQEADNYDNAILPDEFIIVRGKSSAKPDSGSVDNNASVEQHKNGSKPAASVNGNKGRLASAVGRLFRRRS